MQSLRPVDIWFIDHVLIDESVFRARARRLTDTTEEAEDLLHDGYAKLIALDGWRALDNPRAYMLRVLRNLAIERMRRARLVRFERLNDLGPHEPADDAPDAFRITAAREEVDFLLRAIDALPARNRDIVRMRRIEELSPRDIGSALGLSLSTVEKRLARGLALLTRAMECSESPSQGTSRPAERRKRA